MGRASRKKRERRAHSQDVGSRGGYRGKIEGHRAEMYGRTVGSDLASFEAAAARGHDSLVKALISRHNQRMERVGGAIHTEILQRSRSLLSHLMALEWMLIKQGADPDRPPITNGGRWSGEIGSGLDAAAQAVRLLACGQLGGAAQVARSQFERWSMNLAYNLKTAKRADESAAEYYNRIWAMKVAGHFFIKPRPGEFDTFHSAGSGGRVMRPGTTYNQVSEFLHGRGPHALAAMYDAHLLRSSEVDVAGLAMSNSILDLVELCVDRLFHAVATFCETPKGDISAARFIWSLRELVPSAGAARFGKILLWPLMPASIYSVGFTAPIADYAARLEDFYEMNRETSPKYSDYELSELYLGRVRHRAVNLALRAFEEERIATGLEKLDFRDILDREFRQIVVGETLGLISLWHSQPEVKAAAAAASSGIRSAFWLWLEDDDRAMGVLRNVLMQVARLRVHNQNPDRASKLEARPSTTPRDWLERAGWKRLHAFNVALGELAHTRWGSRWDGARDLLVALQPEDTNPALAPGMGRGYALDTVVRLAGSVALVTLEGLSPQLRNVTAEAMSKTAIFSPEHEKNFERWLDRAWSNRDFDFGAPTIVTRENQPDIVID